MDYSDLAMYSANLYNTNIKICILRRNKNIIICDSLYDFRTFTFGTSKSDVYELVEEFKALHDKSVITACLLCQDNIAVL